MVSVTSNLRYGSTEHIVHPSTIDRAPAAVVVRSDKLDSEKAVRFSRVPQCLWWINTGGGFSQWPGLQYVMKAICHFPHLFNIPREIRRTRTCLTLGLPPDITLANHYILAFHFASISHNMD